MSTVVNMTATDTDNTNETGDDDDDDDDDDEDDDPVGDGGRAVVEELHRELLGLIRNDDASAVRELLDGHAELDVNAKDYRGVTGLGVAVEAGSESVVDLLLSRLPRPDVGDSLMRAISESRDAIAEKLLDVLQSSERPESAQLGYGDSAEYPPHLTPIMLAAQCGNFRMVGLLLDRGHAIPEPHEPRCMCKEVCMSATARNNQLGASEQRLSAFRALSNPSYVMLTAADPILTAFRLSERLRRHGDADGALRAEYDALDATCRAFSVGLVGLCRTSAEVDLILRRSDGCAPYGGEFPYSRLLMAVDLKQKEFVSHAYVQQMLESAWTGDWYAWRRYGMTRKCGLAVVRLVQLPWVVVATLALPWTAAGRHYALPVNRMLSYAASYALFLLALALANNLNTAAWPYRHPVGQVLKGAVAAYSASFAVRTGKLALAQGPYRYFRLLWNAYDCATLAILAGAAACWWWLTYADPRVAPFAAATDNQPPRERKYLRSTDPVLVAEGLLAVATVMAYLRLLFLCQLNYVLGPMQVSLGKMTVDFVRFAVLFAIIMSAFNVGLCTLYQYYEGMTNTDPATGYAVTQDESFVGVMATLKTLFWSIFCMTSTTAGRVVIGSTTVAAAEEDDAMAAQHYFTQFVGTGLYAVFVSVAVFIMLNMLVGTMTNTYQRVTDNAYVEWVFGRTQVYLSFSAHAEPPPPFNLVPSFYCFANAFGLFRYCCRNTADAVLSRISSMSSPPAATHSDDDKFRQLMAELRRRYYRRKLSDDNATKCRPTCGT